MDLTISQISKMYDVTNQSVFVALRKNRLKGSKPDGTHWAISKEDYEDYRSQRYSRNSLKYEGELVFPPRSGLLSVRQAAELLEIAVNRLYYAIYTNRIKYIRKGAAYVLDIDNVRNYAIQYLNTHLND